MRVLLGPEPQVYDDARRETAYATANYDEIDDNVVGYDGIDHAGDYEEMSTNAASGAYDEVTTNAASGAYEEVSDPDLLLNVSLAAQYDDLVGNTLYTSSAKKQKEKKKQNNSKQAQSKPSKQRQTGASSTPRPRAHTRHENTASAIFAPPRPRAASVAGGRAHVTKAGDYENTGAARAKHGRNPGTKPTIHARDGQSAIAASVGSWDSPPKTARAGAMDPNGINRTRKPSVYLGFDADDANSDEEDLEI